MVSTGGSLAAKPQCQKCAGEEQLSRRAGCLVVHYCGREHQTDEWPTHKTVCLPAKKARAKLKREETKLREAPADAFYQASPFENSVGHFWGILETPDYMRTRFGFIEALMKVRTRDALQTTLDHLLDILRLCRSDNMGVRGLIPAVSLRLGRDQEAYDFIKWWARISDDGNYDWGNTDLPYLDVHDGDVFESVAASMPRYSLSHTIALTLIKVRLLLDLKTLGNAAAVGD